MKVSVYDELCGNAEFTVDELKALAPLHLSLEDRVQGIAGRAFDLPTWYGAWQRQQGADSDRTPTHMEVEAVDEFQAKIPWEQLSQAAFLYEQNGEPLKKGFPIRLYVPDGSSECLNVKSVVKIRFTYQVSSAEATYGFKNQVSIEELKFKK
ncbi:molybdopterin-dependent oxidoreductase [Paenibacillus radicis (ex Xue et al. 2023)]|uniref:Molybdopterin-dependent oxidoreductase n=1 Tax=Paenibacillus radicis (ex Xue et al. 2023) TaxID=2972489 RepID=A0ABT1YN55_9BACL|nr:molybdopterin-dependent oxidoreductase [Paenibacillus radicis (ex Xue et al. 2023)]MCR8634609.1 molybdopterin-dependent oxidoreductase [Paenibacillus radicis (ex Xue et al. 2023)]